MSQAANVVLNRLHSLKGRIQERVRANRTMDEMNSAVERNRFVTAEEGMEILLLIEELARGVSDSWHLAQSARNSMNRHGLR